MKKVLIIIAICIVIFNLSASQFACQFLRINPSARDAAFGLESGTASLELLTPASVINNPAKLGAMQGIHLGFTSFAFNRGNFSSSSIVLASSGIGISLPLPNIQSKFGTSLKYQEIDLTNDDGQTIGKFSPLETSTQYAIGINIVPFLDRIQSTNNYNSSSSYAKYYLGYSYNYISSQLIPKNIEYFNHYNPNSDFSKLGFLAQFSPPTLQNTQNDFNFTAGLSLVNPTKRKITYFKHHPANPLPSGLKFGTTVSYKRKADQPITNSLTLPSQNFYSCYASIDYADYSSSDNILGFGLEFTGLDIFSVRIGQTNQSPESQSSTSYSFGLNLNFSKDVNFKIDYTNFFNTKEMYPSEMMNASLNLNLIELF